jgi:hypothetical protein
VTGLPGRGGLGNTRGLHPRWETHHRPTAEEFLTATVKILRHSSGGTFNEATGRTAYPDPALIYEGPARIQRMAQLNRADDIGDRQVVTGGATVSLPTSAAEVYVGDEVQVVTYRDPDSGDPHLVGRPLWVHEVRPGSLLWQRDLVALDAPPTAR